MMLFDVIYMDLEKAFDKVSHGLLITKLKYYKISEHLIGWIKSFLTNRSQRVRINGTFSNWARVLSGIPQGSVLCPLLSLLFINDLACIVSFNSELFLFVDDAKLFRCIEKQSDIIDLKQDLHDLHRWIKNTLLSLNISKCKVICRMIKPYFLRSVLY